MGKSLFRLHKNARSAVRGDRFQSLVTVSMVEADPPPIVAPPRSAASPASLREHAIWLLFYLFLILVVQYRTGAYFDDFSASSDESSHFCNALVIHDYLVGSFPHSPLKFLYTMYARYPKIAIGHWPPASYLIMAFWMLIFGATRTSALLFIAVCAAVMADITRSGIRAYSRPLAAGLSPLFGLLLPVSSLYTASIMMEVPLALFGTFSAVAAVKLLEKDNWKWSILTGMFLSLAIDTKGNALALIPAYIAAVIMCAGWKSLFRIRFAIPLAIVATLCAPVYILSLKATTHWAGARAGLDFTTLAIRSYPVAIWYEFGLGLLVIITAGLVGVLITPSERRKPIWVVAGAWLVFTIVFHLVVPMAVEFRYLAAAFPAVCWFGARGISRLPRPLGWAAAAALICMFVVNLAQTPWRARSGMATAIERVAELGKSQINKGIFIASTDALGEGRAIAEGFQRDRRHRFIFLRASKYISDSDWMGKRYSLVLQTPAAVQEQLESVPASFVIINHDGSSTSNEVVLTERAMRQYADQWKLISHQQTMIVGNLSETIDIYYNRHNSGLPVSRVTVNLKDKTGEILNINLQ